MRSDAASLNRRCFFQRIAILGGVWWTIPGLFAEGLNAAAQRRLIIISPSGTILRYHEGLFPEMLETLKRETRQHLSSQE
jgi:hypothetical protein